MRDMSLGHIDTFTFCIITHRMLWCLDGDWLYFDVPGHQLFRVHGMCDMSLGHGHIDILYQNPPYVMVPEWKLSIIPCPRDINYFLFMTCVICPWDISTHLHSLPKPPVCYSAWMETDYISISPGHELVAVHGMRDMSLGHIDTFTFCMETPYVMAPGLRLIIFPCPRGMY